MQLKSLSLMLFAVLVTFTQQAFSSYSDDQDDYPPSLFTTRTQHVKKEASRLILGPSPSDINNALKDDLTDHLNDEILAIKPKTTAELTLRTIGALAGIPATIAGTRVFSYYGGQFFEVPYGTTGDHRLLAYSAISLAPAYMAQLNERFYSFYKFFKASAPTEFLPQAYSNLGGKALRGAFHVAAVLEATVPWSFFYIITEPTHSTATLILLGIPYGLSLIDQYEDIYSGNFKTWINEFVTPREKSALIRDAKRLSRQKIINFRQLLPHLADDEREALYQIFTGTASGIGKTKEGQLRYKLQLLLGASIDNGNGLKRLLTSVIDAKNPINDNNPDVIVPIQEFPPKIEAVSIKTSERVAKLNRRYNSLLKTSTKKKKHNSSKELGEIKVVSDPQTEESFKGLEDEVKKLEEKLSRSQQVLRDYDSAPPETIREQIAKLSAEALIWLSAYAQAGIMYESADYLSNALGIVDPTTREEFRISLTSLFMILRRHAEIRMHSQNFHNILRALPTEEDLSYPWMRKVISALSLPQSAVMSIAQYEFANSVFGSLPTALFYPFLSTYTSLQISQQWAWFNTNYNRAFNGATGLMSRLTNYCAPSSLLANYFERNEQIKNLCSMMQDLEKFNRDVNLETSEQIFARFATLPKDPNNNNR